MPQVVRPPSPPAVAAALMLVLAVLAGCASQPAVSPSPDSPGTPLTTPSPATSPDGTAPPTEPAEPSPTPPTEPTNGAISVESAAQAAALVLATDERFLGVSAAQAELIGQCCWYQAHEGVGHYLVTVELGWGDCPSGCIESHRWLHRVDLDGTVTLLEQEGDEPIQREPVPGTGSGAAVVNALAGPICPVEPFPPDPNCAPRPVPHAEIVVFDPRGGEVARATTDAEGRLVLELPDGAYYVVAGEVEGLMRAPEPQAFSIATGGRVPVRLDYDTGIR